MELVFGNCSKPKDLLGRHFIMEGQVISAYHPDAVKMEVISEDGKHYPMDTVERQPVFSLFLPHKRHSMMVIRISVMIPIVMKD